MSARPLGAGTSLPEPLAHPFPRVLGPVSISSRDGADEAARRSVEASLVFFVRVVLPPRQPLVDDLVEHRRDASPALPRGLLERCLGPRIDAPAIDIRLCHV